MEYKWKVLSATSIGGFMYAVDGTVVLLALFPIATDLKSDFVTMTWVVVAYLLTSTSLVLSFGRLSDMFGRKNICILGFIVFTIGSALCGFAFTGLSLVGFRIVQGAGGALIVASTFPILSEAFPRSENGRAFGFSNIVYSLGSILGIILGGVIISYTTWRLIFLINVPIGIFATIWGYHALRKSEIKITKESFDIPAALTFTIGLLGILLGVTWGLLYSWHDNATLISFGVSPVFFIVFFIWEAKYSKQPIIDFAFFQSKVFSFSVIAALLQSLALFSVNFLLIFFLEGIVGLKVLTAAYLLVPLGVAAAIASPFAGLLSDKVGSRIVATFGLALQFIVLLLLSGLSTSTSLVDIGLIEAVYGVGSGLFWPANTKSVMFSSLPGRLGVGSGIMATFRNTGMMMSFALALTAASSVIPASIVTKLFVGNLTGKLSPALGSAYLSGERLAFEVSAVLVLAALFFSLVRGSETKEIESSEVVQS